MTKDLLRLHVLGTYDRGAKVTWLLTELGVPFERRVVPRNEIDKPEYLKINPMGRVPVLQIGDQYMFESGAICTYLADLYPEKGLAPELSSPDRPAYLQWMHFAQATLDTQQARIMVIEDIPTGEVHEKKLMALQSDVRDAMETLDRALANGDGSFLVGRRLSAADIAISYHLYWLRMWPELDSQIQPYPRVTDYLDRMKQHPSAIAANVFSYED